MNRIWAGLLCLLAASWVSAQQGYGPYGSGSGRYDRPFHSNVYAGVGIGQLRYSEEGLDAITPATAMVFVGAPGTCRQVHPAAAGGVFEL